VLSDIRTGLPGGADESGGGDGAVAFLFAPDGPALLEGLGRGVATDEFLDRYRQPGDDHSRLWEERFGEHAYRPLAEQAVADAAVAAIARTTDALVDWRARRAVGATVADQVAAGRTDLDYPRFLTWRGQLHREPPRRPDPTAPVAPASLRKERWKFAFHAS